MSSPDEATLTAVAEQLCDELSLKFGGRVGSGAFKITFLVECPRRGRLALKVCDARAGAERHAREMAASRRCSHPRIARIEEYAVVDAPDASYPYVVEEYLDGGTLQSRLDQLGVLTPEQLRPLGAALIEAVEHIASLDLVHRDIKPENVMFRGPGLSDPVLVDFGLVRDLKAKSLTQYWAMRGPGTPYYAAPEQLNNEKPLVSWRTDQFALGVMLCIAATGKHPHGDPPGSAVARAASYARPLPVLAAALRNLRFPAVLRMIEPWPVARFRTPAHLRDAWAEQIEPQ